MSLRLSLMEGTMRNAIPYNKPNIKTGNVERLKPYIEDKKLLNDYNLGSGQVGLPIQAYILC